MLSHPELYWNLLHTFPRWMIFLNRTLFFRCKDAKKGTHFLRLRQSSYFTSLKGTFSDALSTQFRFQVFIQFTDPNKSSRTVLQLVQFFAQQINIFKQLWNKQIFTFEKKLIEIRDFISYRTERVLSGFRKNWFNVNIKMKN